jgi:CBS-domain-containing membrane protein
MPRSAYREDVRRPREHGAQVVEVLPQARARDVMENRPSSYRPSTPAAEVPERMKSRGFEATFVTDSGGRLWGLVSRADLEGALGAARP